MGCDIHVYVEYNPFDEHETMREAHYKHTIPGYISRNYTLFALLGMTRRRPEIRPIVEARGLDVLSLADDLMVQFTWSDDDEHSDWDGAVTFPRPNPYDVRKGKAIRDPHPDWHHASWCSFDELVKVRTALEEIYEHEEHPWGARAIQDINLILSPMCTLEAQGRETRMVYWFDN